MQDQHPFQFVNNYSKVLYEDAVRVNAQAYVGDEGLRDLVGKTAVDLFAKLEASSDMVSINEAAFQFKGVTFRVICAKTR